MLNYIRAELYKVFHRRYFYILVGLVLAGECLFCVSWIMEWPGAEYADMVELMTTTMALGVFLAIPLADMVVSDAYGLGALKNESSFGIPRPAIYLGKLLASAAAALIACALVFGFYLGANYPLCLHSNPAAELEALWALGYTAAAALPLWLGMLSVSVMAFLLLKTNALAGVLLVVGLLFGPLVFTLFEAIQAPIFQQLGALGLKISLFSRFGEHVQGMDMAFLARNWLLGLGWIAVTTGIGLAVFQRKEL